MNKFSSNEIRQLWLNFFKSKNHYELPSFSLIPNNDPSLLWINSGVSVLKKYFNGIQTPPSKRLTNVQRAIRTNDIENVGFTARHHTFFEMLGNFSIGDYFKKEAIQYAWEFLTNKQWIGLNKQNIYISFYEKDIETFNIWNKIIKLNKNHIIKGNKNTNFWEIGEGPCGPNTEIFYDRGKKYDPNNLGIKLLKKNIENNRYLEIWNIVFSQFNNNGDGTYTELLFKNIDTGAGLERITSIIQKTPTNYEIDSFLIIIKSIEKLTNNTFIYNKNNFFENKSKYKKIDISFKIIADHIRAITFAIADGVYPGNKDRNYIIRKLIRRASLYGQQLKFQKPFLYLLVNNVIKSMSPFYNYLKNKKKTIINIIKNEEIKFLNILKKGEIIFNKIKLKYNTISKENAFLLFDSYGLPIEWLTEKAKKNNIFIDIKGFNNLLKNSKSKQIFYLKNKK